MDYTISVCQPATDGGAGLAAVFQTHCDGKISYAIRSESAGHFAAVP